MIARIGMLLVAVVIGVLLTVVVTWAVQAFMEGVVWAGVVLAFEALVILAIALIGWRVVR